jgi:type II secretory pathway component HofQ
MATGKQLKAAMRVRRTAKGPRKKRTRPEPRQYTVVDLERARDRVVAAERRIDNDRSGNPNRARAGLKRAQLDLSVIESQLRLRNLLG